MSFRLISFRYRRQSGLGLGLGEMRLGEMRPNLFKTIKISGGSSLQYLGGHGPMASAAARAYNGGLGAEPPAGSRGRAPGQGVRGLAP